MGDEAPHEVDLSPDRHADFMAPAEHWAGNNAALVGFAEELLGDAVGF